GLAGADRRHGECVSWACATPAVRRAEYTVMEKVSGGLFAVTCAWRSSAVGLAGPAKFLASRSRSYGLACRHPMLTGESESRCVTIRAIVWLRWRQNSLGASPGEERSL